MKAVKKAADAGKIVVKKGKKAKRPSQTSQSRTDEMRELFQSEMSEKKQKRNLRGGGKKKSSFKSKSRYVIFIQVLFSSNFKILTGQLYALEILVSSCLVIAEYLTKLCSIILTQLVGNGCLVATYRL